MRVVGMGWACHMSDCNLGSSVCIDHCGLYVRKRSQAIRHFSSLEANNCPIMIDFSFSSIRTEREEAR